MATPTAARNKSRFLKKFMAILLYGNTGGDTNARLVEDDVGHATVKKSMGRMWESAGVPSGGDGVSDGDICLDTTNDDAYRYATIGTDAWYLINITT